MDNNPLYIMVSGSFGESPAATRPQLQELLDGWNRQEEGQADIRGEGWNAPYLETAVTGEGVELRLYRSDTPGDFETLGYEYNRLLDRKLVSDKFLAEIAWSIYLEVYGTLDDKNFQDKKLGEIADWLEEGDIDSPTIENLVEGWREYDEADIEEREV